MEIAKARELYRKKKEPRRKAYGRAVNQEKGEVRFRELMTLREQGLTKAEAAERVGMTLEGVNTALRRHNGSKAC